jgi:hypothetical protein
VKHDGHREHLPGLDHLSALVQGHGQNEAGGRPGHPLCLPAHGGDRAVEPPSPVFRQALGEQEVGVNRSILRRLDGNGLDGNGGLGVEFTQHTGDEMYRQGRGWAADWTPAEAARSAEGPASA